MVVTRVYAETGASVDSTVGPNGASDPDVGNTTNAELKASLCGDPPDARLKVRTLGDAWTRSVVKSTSNECENDGALHVGAMGCSRYAIGAKADVIRERFTIASAGKGTHDRAVSQRTA